MARSDTPKVKMVDESSEGRWVHELASQPEADGGMTGSSDGAPFSVAGSGPDHSAAPPPVVHDPPIQHDSLGDALIGAVAGGITAIAKGGSVVGHAIVDGIVGGVKSEVMHGGESDGGAPHPGEDDPPDATVGDATVPPRP